MLILYVKFQKEFYKMSDNSFVHEDPMFYAEMIAQHPNTPVDVLSKIYDRVDPAIHLSTHQNDRILHYTLSHPNADHTIYDKIMRDPHHVNLHINSLMENENLPEDVIDKIHDMHPYEPRVHSNLLRGNNLSLPTYKKILDTYLSSVSRAPEQNVDLGFVQKLYTARHITPAIFDKIFDHEISRLDDPNVPISPQTNKGLINGGQDEIKGKHAIQSLNELVNAKSKFLTTRHMTTLESLPEDIKQQRPYNSMHANIIANLPTYELKKLYSQDSLLNLMASEFGNAAEQIKTRKLLTLDSIKKGVETKQINNDRLRKIIDKNGNDFFDKESVKHLIQHSDYGNGSTRRDAPIIEHLHQFLHRKNSDGTHDFDPYRQIINKIINHNNLGIHTPLTEDMHSGMNSIRTLVNKHRDIVQDDETHKKFAKDVLKPIHQYYRDQWRIADKDLDKEGLEDPTVE